jgi:uncharacterized membrane protein
MFKPRTITLTALAVIVIFTALRYNDLPERIPSRWNIEGEVDGYMDRMPSAIFLPGMAAILGLGLPLFAHIDPRAQDRAKVRRTMEWIAAALTVFFAVLHITILTTFENPDGVPRMIFVSVGLLFAFIGYMIADVEPNWFAGIRTPWTLSSDEVWRRTHHLGSRLFVIAGLVMIPASLFAPLEAAFVLILLPILIAAFVPIVYSYWLWRQMAA